MEIEEIVKLWYDFCVGYLFQQNVMQAVGGLIMLELLDFIIGRFFDKLSDVVDIMFSPLYRFYEKYPNISTFLMSIFGDND